MKRPRRNVTKIIIIKQGVTSFEKGVNNEFNKAQKKIEDTFK